MAIESLVEVFQCSKYICVKCYQSYVARESMMLRTYWTYTKEKPSYYGYTIHNSCRRLLHMQTPSSSLLRGILADQSYD